MISIVKEMCIFMIIAQAVMFFVPGSAYVKYVRVLVGIMMILGITGPVFGLLLDEEKKQEIRQRADMLEQSISMEGYEFSVQDNQQEIYRAVGQELKERLWECESGYNVLEAEVLDDRVVITVEKTENGKSDNTQENSAKIIVEPVTLGGMREEKAGEDSGEAQRLKELYGNHIGVSSERIEIILQ